MHATTYEYEEEEEDTPIIYAPTTQRVVVTDIHMSFTSMVGFMVKWSLAAIPALLILGALGFVLFLFLAAVLAG